MQQPGENEDPAPEDLRAYCTRRFVNTFQRFRPERAQLSILEQCVAQLSAQDGRLDHMLCASPCWGKRTCALMLAMYCHEKLGMSVMILGLNQYALTAMRRSLANLGWLQCPNNGGLKLRVFRGEALVCDADLVVVDERQELQHARLPSIQRTDQTKRQSVLRLFRWHSNPKCDRLRCTCPKTSRLAETGPRIPNFPYPQQKDPLTRESMHS